MKSGGCTKEAFAAYARELESLRARLAADAFAFFQGADVHDGALIHLHLAQGEPGHGEQKRLRPVAVELAVREWSGTVWTLRYSDVRRVLIDFPSEDPLFYSPSDGFEDWGYHELSDAGDGFLRHEVLSRRDRSGSWSSATYPQSAVDPPQLPTARQPTPNRTWLGVGRWECLGSWRLGVGSRRE